MCYTEQTWVPTLLIGLETFLGGMETAWSVLEGAWACYLETFLGGMETWTVRGGEAAPPALKPSLVEWKHHPA